MVLYCTKRINFRGSASSYMSSFSVSQKIRNGILIEGTTIIAHSVGTAVKQSADYSSTVVCLEDPRTTERTKKDTP